jgi:hypothetical protein
VRKLLAGLAVIIPLSSSHAEELKLQCGNDLLFIETTDRVIHDGRIGETLWQNTNFNKTEASVSSDYPACKRHVSEYVRISSQKIEFGYKSAFLNNCGSGDSRRGDVEQKGDYSIDRITGLADLGNGDVRCERYTGKAF